MSSFNAAAWNQQSLAYFPHTDTSGETWQHIRKGTATSNGAAGGTTVIDTNSASGGADTYNGRYYVRMLSGTCEGQRKRIVDDNGSGTLTLENNGFTAQIDSGDEYEILLGPDPVVVVDSSSGETDMVDAVRNEKADDFWIDYYACPITGTHRGKKAKITDYTKTTGTFVLEAAFGSQLAAGDVVLLRKFIDISDPSDGTTHAFYPRPQTRVNNAMSDGVVGDRGGTFGFSSRIYASGSLAASGSKANSNPLGDLLVACGLVEQVDTSSTIGAGSTTTGVELDSGSWENHTIGGGVIYNGQFRRITNLTDGGAGTDTVTVSPAFPTAPVSGQTLHAVRMYRKSLTNTGFAVGFEWETDGHRTTITGCKGTVVINDANPLTATFTFQVDDFYEEKEAQPYNAGTAYTTADAVLSVDRIAYLDTTKVDIGGFTCSPNTETAAKDVQGSSGINGRSGYQFTNLTACGGSYRTLRDADGSTLVAEERFWTRSSQALLVIFGSHGDTFAVAVPASRLIEYPKKTNNNGMIAHPNVWASHDAGTQTDGASATQKVPDFALYLT